MVAEFRRALEAELDYLQEANNLRLLGKNLEEFEAIVVRSRSRATPARAS